MSGITPILDTLLHQVLGKRVDLPPARALNEPVRPLAPESAPQAVHSDSRLDPRPAAPGALLSRPTPRDGELPAPRLPSQPASGSPGSAQLHLSDAARTIADVLARHPGPASVLRVAAPLLAAPPAHLSALSVAAPASSTPASASAVGGSTPAGVLPLAGALQASIENSGLFYESHLQRWYQGKMSLEQLQREPQQQLPSGPAESRAPGIPEALQGLLRQQLEMVAAPVLRWEGDAWTGLFLALVIELPPELRRGPGDHDHEGQDASDAPEGDAEWRSELSLEVAELGSLRARLKLCGDRLDLELSSAQASVLEVLKSGSDDLRERLLACGLASASVRVMAADDGDGAVDS